ncbi:phosphoribosyltransferase family protein, partial [Streptomyces galilaeus]|uniref:phosphoribosyltransferase family protein n=1 Tax=Streptomyces galilaeus TaxID=33899 RepID=UPI0038F7C049
NVENPLVIGPDAESEQWVKMVAEPSHAPYIILKKSRHGDCDVDITLPAIQQYKNCTPVLVDDIVSTASTMLKTIELLQERDFTKTICLAT